ncbi:hypothetical protein D1159_11425 [Pseudoflavonifractor sp. 524-17]|uniref:5-bromo-4-chloroindolyl phosphate hydrolysis family protein n=1 Tax=Pseudoflavonifractor sp. 524-17 TaxID=2304577 RepID=UPI00137ACE72|nr:5-bromo-4-chloroindolyl phosphate hydrolysis family protein [Pseudoflavonifractor sp. 524-17]NCE65169.1 hypothetical protein [Pseudoflavonifractor sp. 524-17]
MSEENRGYHQENEDLASWIVILVALAVFFPVGLYLLYRKLSQGEQGAVVCQAADGSSGQGAGGSAWQKAPQAGAASSGAYRGAGVRRRETVRPGTQGVADRTPEVRRRQPAAQPGTQGVSPTVVSRQKAQPIPRRVVRRVPVKRNWGRGMIVWGVILTLIPTLAVGPMAYDFYGYNNPLEALAVCTPFGVMLAGGLVLLGFGISRSRKAKRFRRYLALIGRQTTVQVALLAQAMRVPVNTVCGDLQEMLDRRIFPTGYLDMASGHLVLTDEGITPPAAPVEEPAAQPEPEEDQSGENSRFLAQIQAVNRAISDQAMSRKIDRIEEITQRIFNYQEKNPEKGGQLRSFLSYYLPTTLKILNSYAQLEEQGVEGKNITAAKERIEGMMDKVVEGFEKQLDKLFEGTAMDITTDVMVLEQMLERDGLSQNGGLTLNG